MSNGATTKGQSVVVDAKTVVSNASRVLHKSTNGPKIENVPGKRNGTSVVQMRIASNGLVNKIGDTNVHRTNSLMKRNEVSENVRSEENYKKSQSPRNTMNLDSRGSSNFVNDISKFRYYSNRAKIPQSSEIKENSQYDYKTGTSSITNSGKSGRFEQISQISHRDASQLVTSQNTRTLPRSENSSLDMERNAIDQRSVIQKIATSNFSSFRTSQTAVEARHQFANESRSKYCEASSTNSAKLKTDVNAIQSTVKDLSYGGQTFHGYGTSAISGITSMQNLANVPPGNITPYVRSDSYGGATVASLLFSETAPFSQSSTYNPSQVGQLNQYQTYDPSSYATTPVNSVMTQYSPENTITYPQYENPPQFVQANHYTANDMGNNHQFQYQTTNVGQIQESPLFLQSLPPSPIAVTEQYAAGNYARAVRTELLPRLRGPPRFNK